MINTKVGAIKQQKPGSGFSLTDKKDDNLFKQAGETLKVSPGFQNLGDSNDDLSSTVVTPVKQSQSSVPTRDLNPGQTFGKNYQIVSLIGKGGMSAVYKAYDKMLKRNVAVKVLLYKRKMDKKARARFVQEGIALSKLDHPNLIRVYEFGDADGSEPYLVMDYLEGHALSDLMSKTNPMSVTRAVSILKQCTLALRHAHNKGVVHRDLKPSNIMVTASEDSVEDVVKIIDFGIAKVEESDSMRLTETGEVFGSPLYMSPEQCRGEKLDERSDMYSLGCVFFEMLTGVPPFKGQDFADTVGMHFNDAPAPLATLRPDIKYPAELDKVINKLMHKERSKRYQNMDELAEDVEPLYEKHCPRNAFRKTPGPLPAVAVDTPRSNYRDLDNTSDTSDTRDLSESSDTGDQTYSDDETAKKKSNQLILIMALVTVLLAVGVGGKIFYDYKVNLKQVKAAITNSNKAKITPQVNLWMGQMKYGDLYFDKGDTETAEEYFNKALTSAQTIEDSIRNQHIAAALQQLIDVDFVTNGLRENSAAGLKYKEDLHVISPRVVPPSDTTDGIIEQTKRMASDGKLKEAKVFIEGSIAACRANPGRWPKDLAMLEFADSRLYWLKHQDVETAEHLALAEKSFTAANLPNLALLCKAGQQLINNQQNDCQNNVSKLLPQLREELPRPDWAIAAALDLSANADSKLIEARKAFDKMQKDINSTDPTSDSLNDLQENFDSAEANYKREIAILSRTEPYNKSEILAAYHGLMNSYMSSKQNDKLEGLIPKVIAYGVTAPCESEVTRAQLTQNLAFLRCLAGQYEQSEALYKSALTLAKRDESRNAALITNILGGMSRLAYDRVHSPLRGTEKRIVQPPPSAKTIPRNSPAAAAPEKTIEPVQRKQFSNHARRVKPEIQAPPEDSGHGKEL